MIMKGASDLKPILAFLDDLQQNNNKAWFESNRSRYEQARQTFEKLVEYLISELDPIGYLRGVSAKECIFRINRDVRFSKDKSPYKTNLGAEIAPGGRKSGNLGYYIHLTPHDGSMTAGGLYAPTSEQLAKFREAIANDAAPFKRVLSTKTFVGYFGSVEGDRLSTAPQGYSRDHPEIDLLRLKQVMVVHHFTDKQVTANGFPAEVIQIMKAMKPFNDYLNRVLH
jgi:uncharacterized protein (TIGR02453 family)